MQCPYCRSDIGFFKKFSPCPECQHELKTKLDYKTFLSILIPLAVVYSLVRILLGVDGFYQYLLLGVVFGFAMFPATVLVPKNVNTQDDLTFPNLKLGPPLVFGAAVLVTAGILFFAIGGAPESSKTVNVITSGDVDEAVVRELLEDPEVQKLLED